MSRNKWILSGALLGAVGGYIYYQFMGCQSGSCPLTNTATKSAAYFSLIGALALATRDRKLKKHK